MAKVNVAFGSGRVGVSVAQFASLVALPEFDVGAVVVEQTCPEGKGIAVVTADAKIRVAPAGAALDGVNGFLILPDQPVYFGVHGGQKLRFVEAEA